MNQSVLPPEKAGNKGAKTMNPKDWMDISMFAATLGILYDWYVNFKQMSTPYKGKFCIGTLIFLAAILVIWFVVHAIIHYLMIPVKLILGGVFAMTVLIPGAIYYLTKIKIFNATSKNKQYSCDLPDEYQRWVNSIKLIKVLILLEALAVTLMLVSDLMGGDESWVLHGWNKVIQNNQVDI